MKTGLAIEVGAAAFALALAAIPAAHAREIASGDEGRGAGAAESTGRYPETLADHNAQIVRRPTDAAAYLARGRLNLLLGKAGAAAADLRQAVRLKPNDPYGVLWLHYARNKESAPDAMELQVNAGRADRAAWPGPLLDYMTGKIDASAVLAKAGEGQAKTVRMCEAQLFMGQDDLAAGRRSQGLDRLKAAARECEVAPREAKLARAELPGGSASEPAPTFVADAAPPPRAPSAAAEPNLKPAWIRPAPQPVMQPPIRTAVQSQTVAGDPLLLRGSLR
jgi:hypothetical protein